MNFLSGCKTILLILCSFNKTIFILQSHGAKEMNGKYVLWNGFESQELDVESYLTIAK